MQEDLEQQLHNRTLLHAPEPSLRERLTQQRAMRERVRMWRLHYFVDICRLQQFATILSHDLLADPLEFVDGALPVPTGPGLGIELDYEAVEFCEELYREYGEFTGYGPVTESSPIPPHVPR